MKIWDFEKIVFRLNVLVTIAVFILLAPTTYVFEEWFPDKRDSLWLFPVSVTIVSCFLWFLVRLALPSLIRIGFFEDRRGRPRPKPPALKERIIRTALPSVNLSFHLFLLILSCFCLISFLRSDNLNRLFSNLP